MPSTRRPLKAARLGPRDTEEEPVDARLPPLVELPLPPVDEDDPPIVPEPPDPEVPPEAELPP
ncbi:hypothetical protein ACIQ7Q_11755 [Streptomyces sp. NPDC096176]|uniref:hypothetical protein n=1 Tax=Streptomyces sp. NPDC096176 TaxID=3366079 RepID=UPI00380A03E6